VEAKSTTKPDEGELAIGRMISFHADLSVAT